MAENFVNIIRDIRGSTNDPATDTSCIYGDMKSMHEEYKGFKQITDEERLKLENIEEEATKNSTDSFLLSRENHTGNMSIANVQDTPSRMAMTIHEKNKLEAINVNATVNDTDANLRNRATHTGTQSIDTITDTSTHVKMSVAERSKLSTVAAGATKNATDAELRSRSTHTGTQSADSIVDGLVNAAYTLQEKNKLSVLSTTVPPAHTHDNTSITSLSYSKLTGVPISFNPSEHLHDMDEITTGMLPATRITETNDLKFVTNIEKQRLAISETTDKKGVPFGYVPLDGNGKINSSYLDALNVIDVFTPVNQEAMLLLTSAKPGDIAYVQDSQNTYMLVGLPVHIQDNWKQMNSGSGVITFNGLNGVVSVSTDEIPEGSANIYFTNERVDDRVANILTPGANVSIVYDDDNNQIIISANDTSVEWSEIQNKPNTKIDVNLSGDISGSGSVVLSQLGDGTLNIENIILENVGTAGTYRSVTTDVHGRVISGSNPTTIAEYEISDAYTKTEIQESLPAVGLDTLNVVSPDIAGQTKWNKDKGTPELSLDGLNSLFVGQDTIRKVINKSSNAISKGSVVEFVGGFLGKVSVKTFDGSFANSNKIYGIAMQSISVDQEGYVLSQGLLSGIDATGSASSETWISGDILFVKPNSNGLLTNVEPDVSELKVAVAKVIDASLNGIIDVKITTLNENAFEPRNLNIQEHISDETNPHNVTKAQVGLGNVDNTADINKVVFSAGKLTTARNISISGDASGSTSFDGGSNVDIEITVADNSHKHTIENITGLPETNVNRADKWLAAQNIARMVMQDGLLVKIRYNQDVDQDYELLSYDNVTGNLTNISHYIEGVYMGITNFEYADGDLVSVIFIGV